MAEGRFVYLDSATLTTMLADWQAGLAAIAGGAQSYSIAGRTFTRANVTEIAKVIEEISFALTVKNGTLTRRTYAGMSSR